MNLQPVFSKNFKKNSRSSAPGISDLFGADEQHAQGAGAAVGGHGGTGGGFDDLLKVRGQLQDLQPHGLHRLRGAAGVGDVTKISFFISINASM